MNELGRTKIIISTILLIGSVMVLVSYWFLEYFKSILWSCCC